MGGTLRDLTEVAEGIRAARGKLEKVRLLAAFLARLSDEDLAPAVLWFAGYSSKKVLQVGFAALEAAGLAATGATREAFAAAWLQWSDMGDALAAIAPPDRPASGLSISALAARLDALGEVPAGLEKTAKLTELLAPLSVPELRYVGKILTGELRIGLSEGLVEEAIAKAFDVPVSQVRRAHQRAGDVASLALAARHGTLASLEVQLFSPLKPMLATPEESARCIADRLGETLCVEDKYDGIRAQAHRSPERVMLFSRTLNDVSEQFPEVAESLAKLPGTLILDGELLAHTDGVARPFFDLQKRLGRKQPSAAMVASIPVALFAFDLLYQDGEPLLDRPFRERRARLEALPQVPGLFISPLAHVPASELDLHFARARARANEGLMVKDPASAYTPGRRGMSWLKYKKALDPLDVVVTGVEYGHGRRREVLSDYSFAVRDERTGALVNIGKAYSGLTDVEILEMTRWFLDHTIEKRGRYLKVEPAVVLEVAFEAIQESPRHASGFALRFPRILRIRNDKTPADINTLADVRKRYASYRAVYDAPGEAP